MLMQPVAEPVDRQREGTDNLPAPVDHILEIDVVLLQQLVIKWAGEDLKRVVDLRCRAGRNHNSGGDALFSVVTIRACMLLLFSTEVSTIAQGILRQEGISEVLRA